MKVLALDIECTPGKVYTWSLWKPTIGITQIIEPPRMLCFSAQWQGSKKVLFYSEFHHSRKEMLDELHALLDEADVIITYNGKRFDLPWIHGELILEGYTPPSPVHHVDLYQVIKSNSRLLSNKLDYVAQRYLDDQKVTHSGFQLWVDCMAGDEKAWNLMRKYAKKDTALLHPLYQKLLPWTKGHPNAALHYGSEGCPKCGSEDVQRRGYSYTGVSKFQRFRCNDCGAWSRSGKRVEGAELR